MPGAAFKHVTLRELRKSVYVYVCREGVGGMGMLRHLPGENFVNIPGSQTPYPIPQLLQPIAGPVCTQISHIILYPGSDLFTYSRGTLCAGEAAVLVKPLPVEDSKG